jgi:hypothetical protein
MIPVLPHYSTPKVPKRQAGPTECKAHLAAPQFRILLRSRASAMMAWCRPHYRRRSTAPLAAHVDHNSAVRWLHGPKLCNLGKTSWLRSCRKIMRLEHLCSAI